MSTHRQLYDALVGAIQTACRCPLDEAASLADAIKAMTYCDADDLIDEKIEAHLLDDHP